MAMRFRKSFKIAPGIRVNLNKKSAGVTIGNKGGRVTFNTRGRVTTSTSIPGSGIYFQDSHTIGSKKNKSYNSNYSDSSVENVDPIETRFDAKTLESLNDKAFWEYSRGYIAYAESLKVGSPCDDPEAVTEQLRLIREETERRKENPKLSHRKETDFFDTLVLLHWPCFFLSAVFMVLMVIELSKGNGPGWYPAPMILFLILYIVGQMKS